MKVKVAKKAVLERTLMRKRRAVEFEQDVDLGLVLEEILAWANRLVPAEGGSILLDDPVLKTSPREDGKLYFAACFGKKSASLAGTTITAAEGIAGTTYRTGVPYISQDVSKDSKFLAKIDKKLKLRTSSIICCPIFIKGIVIGVIELINRKHRPSFDRADLALLEIFAGYTATLMENALAARGFAEISKRDNLTGLYNDRYFFVRLEQEVSRVCAGEGDVSLLFFDLDRFKEVNDNHGHLAGSRVLKEIAEVLRQVFKKIPCVLARYGGDEYVIVLPGMKLAGAAKCGEAVRSAIERKVFLNRRGSGGEPPIRIKGVITCSLGVASLLENAKQGATPRVTAESLIRAADRAMYCAKDSGKNLVCISKDTPEGDAPEDANKKKTAPAKRLARRKA